MGLDTTHGCWHGAYSLFRRWRVELALTAGIPLDLMEGYYPPDFSLSTEFDKWLPIKWEVLKPDVLHVLLNHSDCDGWIPVEYCGPLADRLAELLPLLLAGNRGGGVEYWGTRTQEFIDGLRLAASLGENVEFG